MSEMLQTNGGWRSAILAQFTPEIGAFSPVTVVLDPDRLLSEQKLLSALMERGFEVVHFDDPIAFRYLYETRFRVQATRSDGPRLIMAMTDGDQPIPFDVQSAAMQVSRVLTLGLGTLFPQLTPSVVADLDREDLDALFRAQQIYQPGRLGENATKDFILRHVCEVAPELIRSPADLLRILLRRHYQERQYPQSVDQRFIALVRSGGMFANWPLEVIVPQRNAFLVFLQENWDQFIRSKAGCEKVSEWPLELPFDHPDIRVYMDNFCLEGALKPVQGVLKKDLGDTWYAIAVMAAETEAIGDRFKKLTGHLIGMIPGSAATHAEWVAFAYRWAEWNVLRHQVPHDELASLAGPVSGAQMAVDNDFVQWLLANYGAMGSLSFLPRPVIVHQIVKSMAHGWLPALTAKKKALVVVDGLALDQWLLLRDSLGPDLELSEAGAFAWIPTLTNVSRQSIFAGESPIFFAPTLHTTYKEEQHWCRFWENHGVSRGKVAYAKQKMQEDTGDFVARVIQHVEDTGCVAIGIVVGVIDYTVHGCAMGSGGLHAQIRYWARAGHMRKLLENLVDQGFEVHVTADHGNVEAKGMGKPNVGVVAEQRGERAHILTDELIRNAVHSSFPNSVLWPSIGLPDNYLPLIARGRNAFIGERETTLCHGGLAIEEVIVPYVRVTRKHS